MLERAKEIIYYLGVKLPAIITGKLKGNLVYTHWGRGLNNFGDCLSPYILRHFGLTPVYSQYLQADIMLAGSVLQLIPNEYTGIILGTGADNVPLEFPKASILGVRGKLTQSNLYQDKNRMLLGDAGLVMCYIFPQLVPKNYALGVVMHFIDIDHRYMNEWKDRLGDTVLFINPLQKPDKVIAQIKSCRAIVSSSLHGLVIADSFNIPNIRFVIRETMPKGTGNFDYKYDDYYSAFDVEPELIEIDGNENLDFLLARVSSKGRINAELRANLYRTLKETCEQLKAKERHRFLNRGAMIKSMPIET